MPGLFYHSVLSALSGALSAEQKLRWLHQAWVLTRDFLPRDRRDAWQKLRAGER
jgi:hypothetical protein